MPSINWEHIQQIFSEASNLSPEARARYLDEVCGKEGPLRAEVEALLCASEQASAFLDPPPFEAGLHFATDLGKAMNNPALADLSGRFLGPYRILRELGRGGYGVVYLAEQADSEVRKQVAIKLMQRFGDDQSITRFQQERQRMHLEHPNIAQVLDRGAIDDRPYVVMEYVEGRSLRALLAEHGALPLGEVVEITKQICAGLEAGHRRRIVHRDIKPENIMLQPDGHVKIIDFGIARSRRIDDASTETTNSAGSPAYMSPEQARRIPIDRRSDIYSLGAVIYEMLTGEVAFKGESIHSVLSKQISEMPKPPSHLRPDLNIPESIERIVLQALAKDPNQRQQSAGELAHQLTQSYLSASITVADRVKYGIVRFARWAGWLYFVDPERLDGYIRGYKRRVAGNTA